jgi:Anthrone oxygenase
MTILEILATLSAGVFSGAAIYINLVEHPARMACGTAAALAHWAQSYKRAAVMQAALAVVGLLSAIATWIMGRGIPWLIGGVLLGLVVPVSLLAILPINRQLLNPAFPKDSAEARQLLDRWNRLHATRSLLGFISFVIFVLALCQSVR